MRCGSVASKASKYIDVCRSIDDTQRERERREGKRERLRGKEREGVSCLLSTHALA